ncbi:hypothetical protein AAMO2058_001273400 [Amorphochlora amoebiformis]
MVENKPSRLHLRLNKCHQGVKATTAEIGCDNPSINREITLHHSDVTLRHSDVTHVIICHVDIAESRRIQRCPRRREISYISCSYPANRSHKMRKKKRRRKRREGGGASGAFLSGEFLFLDGGGKSGSILRAGTARLWSF